MNPINPKTLQRKVLAHLLRGKIKMLLLRVYRQYGKSWLLSVAAYWFAIKKPNSTIVIICPTIAQGMDVYWRDQDKLFGIIPPELIARKSEKNAQLILTNGSVIMIRGLDRPDRLRGITADLILGDEVSMWPAKVWIKVLAPIIRVRNGSVLFAGTPLEEEGNEMYEIERNISSGAWDGMVFHYSIYDDPDLDPNELDDIVRMYSTDKLAFKREYLAEYGAAEGKLFPNFSLEFNVIPENSFTVVPTKTTLLGLDWGFNPDPNVASFIQQQGNRIIVFDEHKQSLETINDFYQSIKEIVDKRGIQRKEAYADPSSPGQIAQINQLATANNEPQFCYAGKHDDMGISNINHAMQKLQLSSKETQEKAPQLVITDNCVMTIEALSNYAVVPPGSSRSVVMRNHIHSHIPMAMKYVFNSGRLYIQDAVGNVSPLSQYEDQLSEQIRYNNEKYGNQPRKNAYMEQGFDPLTMTWDSGIARL